MRITSDYKGRNDEYDDDTFRYYESIDEEGYFYEIYAIIDSKPAAIVITDYGVSIDFKTGESIDTNIVPKGIYGDKLGLEWDHLAKIIMILERTGLEGIFYTKEEVAAQYRQWQESEGKSE